MKYKQGWKWKHGWLYFQDLDLTVNTKSFVIAGEAPESDDGECDSNYSLLINDIIHSRWTDNLIQVAESCCMQVASNHTIYSYTILGSGESGWLHDFDWKISQCYKMS